VHQLNGDQASGQSSFEIPVTEEDEGNPAVGPFFGVTRGDVTVYPDPEVPNKSTILWAGESIGFGVFTAENVGAELISGPESQTVAAGSTATFTAEVTGSPNNFQWHRNGVPLPKAPYYQGARKLSLTITGVTPADAGAYELRWNNPISGPGQTTPATLTVTGNHVRWSGTNDIFMVADWLTNPGEVVEGANSYTMSVSQFDRAFNAPNADGTSVGDMGFFRHETVVGDFDKKVRIVSLNSQGASAAAGGYARASLMARESASSPTTRALEIFAANPQGANLVRVAGRALAGQNYSQVMSRNYGGVDANLPNQWLRMRRVGNAFSFYVGTDGDQWALIAEQYLVLPQTLSVGTYVATDDEGASEMLTAEFANYGDHVPADTTPPTLVSVGTLDKQTVGVKFSEAVNAMTATDHRNYGISQGTDLRRPHGGQRPYGLSQCGWTHRGYVHRDGERGGGCGRQPDRTQL
jgi:hypothetical protein